MQKIKTLSPNESLRRNSYKAVPVSELHDNTYIWDISVITNLKGYGGEYVNKIVYYKGDPFKTRKYIVDPFLAHTPIQVNHGFRDHSYDIMYRPSMITGKLRS